MPRFKGSRSSLLAHWASINAKSDVVRAMGPRTEIEDQPRGLVGCGTKPGEGRRPTTPHSEAGRRKEPPVSEPVARLTKFEASAAADPPDEPPAVKLGLNGLPVAPQTGLRLFPPAPCSGTLVLPRTMAPTVLSEATRGMSTCGT